MQHLTEKIIESKNRLIIQKKLREGTPKQEIILKNKKVNRL